jgi:beta-lactam-binding protein with PASTA domain
VLWILGILGILGKAADTLLELVQHHQYSRRQRERVAIPDVMSLPFNQAWETLVLAGFDVKVSRLEQRPAPEMGFVVGQYPPAGRVARRNTRVRITVHHPPDPANPQASPDKHLGGRRRHRPPAPVPDVRGLAFSQAWEKLILADFTVRVDRSWGDPRPVVGPVIAQSPPPGTMAPRWTQVRVRVEPRS